MAKRCVKKYNPNDYKDTIHLTNYTLSIDEPEFESMMIDMGDKQVLDSNNWEYFDVVYNQVGKTVKIGSRNSESPFAGTGRI